MNTPLQRCRDERGSGLQIYQLGQFVTDAVAERAQLAVIDVDPHARLRVERLQRQMWVDTPMAADAVADSLVRAGLRLQSWAAEVPMRDGYARVTLRPRVMAPR
jgi:hypothetical protein